MPARVAEHLTTILNDSGSSFIEEELNSILLVLFSKTSSNSLRNVQIFEFRSPDLPVTRDLYQ